MRYCGKLWVPGTRRGGRASAGKALFAQSILKEQSVLESLPLCKHTTEGMYNNGMCTHWHVGKATDWAEGASCQ